MKCIYSIQCRDKEITEFYIGSSKDFDRRFTEHINYSNNVNRNNTKLYKFINNNGGIDNWEFVVEQKCDELNIYELLELEQIYLDLLNPSLNTLKKSNEIPKWKWVKK